MIVDISGVQFGRLTAIRPTSKRTKGRDVYWMCKCRCGKVKDVIGQSLRSGNTKSCGCLHRELMSGKPGESVLNKTFIGYRASAKKRNLEFSLTKSQFRNLVGKKCVYCDSPPRQKKIGGLTDSYLMNGVDRIDSNYGYTVKNCVVACSTCNQMKWNLSVGNFLSHVRRICEFTDGQI